MRSDQHAPHVTRVVLRDKNGVQNAFGSCLGHDILFRMYEEVGFHSSSRTPGHSGPLPIFCVGTLLAMLGESSA